MGRIREIARTPKTKRKRNPVIYLICEGSETEIKYFKNFRSRGCNIDIIPIPSQYKAADKLVQKTKSTLGSYPYYPEDGDKIWCVFDRDDNTNEMLDKARSIAEKEGYEIAFSNPSFEIWFLLHYCNQLTAVEDCQEAIKLLKKKGRLENYAKNIDIYAQLKPLQPHAIKRARKLIEQQNNTHKPILSRNSNPITTVSELVVFLNDKASRT